MAPRVREPSTHKEKRFDRNYDWDVSRLGLIGSGEKVPAMLSGFLQDVKSGSTSRRHAALDPDWLITSYTVSVESKSMRDELSQRSEFAKHLRSRLEILHDSTLWTFEQADVILLAAPSQNVKAILREGRVADALRGKLLISLTAEITIRQLTKWIYGTTESPGDGCYIVRAIYDPGSSTMNATTMISKSSDALPDKFAGTPRKIFERLGDVYDDVDDADFSATSALTDTSQAFLLMVFDSILDGAVNEGLDRTPAKSALAKSFAEVLRMILKGKHPAALRESMTSPGGATNAGLRVLKKARVENAFSAALMASSQKGRDTT